MNGCLFLGVNLHPGGRDRLARLCALRHLGSGSTPRAQEDPVKGDRTPRAPRKSSAYRRRPLRPGVLPALLLVCAVAASCGDSSTEPDGDPPPANHTVSIGGALHDPGLNDPETNCTACHGATLQGGPDGQPSCFTCHGRRW